MITCLVSASLLSRKTLYKIQEEIYCIPPGAIKLFCYLQVRNEILKYLKRTQNNLMPKQNQKLHFPIILLISVLFAFVHMIEVTRYCVVLSRLSREYRWRAPTYDIDKIFLSHKQASRCTSSWFILDSEQCSGHGSSDMKTRVQDNLLSKWSDTFSTLEREKKQVIFTKCNYCIFHQELYL